MATGTDTLIDTATIISFCTVRSVVVLCNVEERGKTCDAIMGR